MATTPASPKAKSAAAPKASGGSGLRRLQPNEVLFNDGDPGNSLYIIQKGQLRLYKPKGKGFIEIAVLRAGEVIGEMAYFTEDSEAKRRSCSAKAMIVTDIIEISFAAFDKTMQNLNPWFKTIVNTLAARLRKTNDRMKELESNSVSHGYGNKAATYEFLRPVDIVKIMSVLFLTMKGHGENSSQGVSVHKKVISFYAFDIFGLMESKFDELINFLSSLGHVAIAKDKEGMPALIVVKNLETLRSLLIFFNTQRILPPEKQTKVPPKTEQFLDAILEQVKEKRLSGDTVKINLTPILEHYQAHNVRIELIDLDDARIQGFVGDTVVEANNQLVCDLYLSKLLPVMPALRMQNAIQKLNENQGKF